MRKIAVLQSNYIPWKGNFDLINSVDEFVLYDDVQYTKNDWRNRNQIKTHNGLLWLTIPIKRVHKFQDIKDTLVANQDWCAKHFQSLHQFYAKAPYFDLYADELKKLYQECEKETHLSIINYRFLTLICKYLGIQTDITWSMDYHLESTNRVERLIEVCQKTGADHYLSGPAAKDYNDPAMWEENKIELEYFSYQGYPKYPQLFGPFRHNVTVLDLLFNVGPDAPQYMLSFKDKDG